MTEYKRWKDVRAAHVERAGGEEAVEAGKQELLATVHGHRLAGFEVLARYAAALGGRLHQAISFDDGDIATIA
ncbi:hypothetical protein H4696_008190 [Amycolatopsis lexingtonensis]|uniref:Uncharacterized protein n=1 Tax=Amycolatopsis lexingtonensis TaxID=218822 RepID=A0ABR9ID31_9PSEU|nr:hypothetical protein [Amycolatopsis lexingtonensis]MBE1501090.1 hypothetical protein [Amycolatopsis lexingtonensis]